MKLANYLNKQYYAEYKNISKDASFGTNEFCSGVSPAESSSNSIHSDKYFSKNLDYYVINSYWNSSIDHLYHGKIPIFLILDQSKIHFNYFNNKNFFSFYAEKPTSKILEKYSIIKTFTGSGPKIYILKRNNLSSFIH